MNIPSEKSFLDHFYHSANANKLITALVVQWLIEAREIACSPRYNYWTAEDERMREIRRAFTTILELLGKE